ncbi:UDP-N-acetylglucosamine 2-epimerase (non-hydrolyzing) [Acinetobacter baumannii]|uniref:UDP-N-acetylglucosamine 2-epimerase (non-hydrolyzing) n=1 Tax=Acinetobacter baumannii TaxID=470 RepID=A0A3F3MTJ5_ACIBA|nr:UDP-N-acetylglucosamine 2-epimerase (non-hydrolyzing) [Acinetobacter baumannii]PZM17683.1 UDP-N-acetylglucosamine 2-epimerase (non-hydrolyzing) [Acinetobacter baumannii]
MIKVLISFGTRPEAIKMAPVIQCLKKDNRFDVKVLVTAQHREMLDQVLEVFKITPDFDLNLMKANQSLNQLSANILQNMDSIYQNFRPHILLVHGDTLSAFVVAQSAFYNQIDIGHVEAGLRTYNLKSPWPEEGNRQLISKISNLHFAPTELAAECLKKENIQLDNIYITGNTVVDALLSVSDQILPLPIKYNGSKWNLDEKIKKILITGHRRENFGQGFINICQAIKDLALKYPAIEFIYPVHLNSYLILTDSGGIQEEAPSLGVPILVMRDTTERQEAIDAGTVKLVGTETASITFWVETLLENSELYHQMARANNPYGDGTASIKIKQILLDKYSHTI